MDKSKLLDRISAIDPETMASLIKKALEDSGIAYSNEPGGVTFSGLDVVSTMQLSFAFNSGKQTRRELYGKIKTKKAAAIHYNSNSIYTSRIDVHEQTSAA